MQPEELSLGKSLTELLSKLISGEKEAKNHPSPGALDTFCFSPEKLASNEVESIKTHLADCQRCQEEVKDTKSKESYLRRHKTIHGDCE